MTHHASWKNFKTAASFHANRDPSALFVIKCYDILTLFTYITAEAYFVCVNKISFPCLLKG